MKTPPLIATVVSDLKHVADKLHHREATPADLPKTTPAPHEEGRLAKSAHHLKEKVEEEILRWPGTFPLP